MSLTERTLSSILLAAGGFSGLVHASTLTCRENTEAKSEFHREYILTQKDAVLEIVVRVLSGESSELYDENSYLVNRNLSDLNALLNPGARRARIPDVSFKLSSEKQETPKFKTSIFRQLVFSPTYHKDEVYVRENTLTVRSASDAVELDLDKAQWSVNSTDSERMICVASP